MKTTFKIPILIVLLSCLPVTQKTENQSERNNFGQIIDEYLRTNLIDPTLIFNNDGRKEFILLQHNISWKELEEGIEITVDGNVISTSDKETLNPVWGSGVGKVNFANYLQQVKIYENEYLVGFVLTNVPCTGLGCGVNYQIIYDLKTKRQSYFGRFRTGFEFELYNFNSDNKPDYLSKTFYGRNALGIDTTEFVLYSKTADGNFEEFKSANQEKYWFKHIYSEFNSELHNEKLEEKWIEEINKNGR
jgi:hypothetical protein